MASSADVLMKDKISSSERELISSVCTAVLRILAMSPLLRIINTLVFKLNKFLNDASVNSGSVGNYIFDLLSGGEDDAEILLSYLER